MKKICEITLYKNEEVDDIQITKDAKGTEVKTTRKITKPVGYKYFIRKTNRILSEAAELFTNSVYWECIKRGILPSSQLQKRYLDDKGVLSEEQKTEYAQMYESLFKKQAELQQLQSVKTEKTDEAKKTEAKLLDEVVDLFTSIQSVENQAGQTLYQHTAENISRNRAAAWWMLHLSYQDDNGTYKEVFPGATLEDRFKVYDSMEEGDDVFNTELLNKLLLITSLWYFGKAETQTDFDIALKMSDNQNLISVAVNAPDTTVAAVKDEVAPAVAVTETPIVVAATETPIVNEVKT